ncbi:MAG: cobalamin biosynthesis protein CbiX [Deltaproteobacteria bacterium]|nr:MAG: cobalamin biosynthesis protein CbiX [Deltaproteobacteria bacterium]
MTDKTALVLVDHGSRREAANAMLAKMVDLLQEQSGGRYIAIEPAHMELAEPTLEQAYLRCIEAGATQVIVSLFFLSPGRHSRSDIPEMVEALQAQYPHVRGVVSEPLGVDPGLATLLLKRADEALLSEDVAS